MFVLCFKNVFEKKINFFFCFKLIFYIYYFDVFSKKKHFEIKSLSYYKI
jgi:hypothetical protein